MLKTNTNFDVTKLPEFIQKMQQLSQKCCSALVPDVGYCHSHSVVCLGVSVCVLVTTVRPAKMAEPINATIANFYTYK